MRFLPVVLSLSCAASHRGAERRLDGSRTRQGGAARLLRFATAFGLAHPIVFTGADVANGRFGVTSIPAVFVVGRDGNVVGSVVGASEAKHAELLALVERALR